MDPKLVAEFLKANGLTHYISSFEKFNNETAEASQSLKDTENSEGVCSTVKESIEVSDDEDDVPLSNLANVGNKHFEIDQSEDLECNENICQTPTKDKSPVQQKRTPLKARSPNKQKRTPIKGKSPLKQKVTPSKKKSPFKVQSSCVKRLISSRESHAQHVNRESVVTPNASIKGAPWLDQYDFSLLPELKKKALADDLRELLSRSADGEALLACETLDRSDRKLLVDIIVTNELNLSQNLSVTPNKLKELAFSVKCLYPSESPRIYYCPQINLGHSKKINSKGKLYQKYVSKRKKFKKTGYLAVRTRKTKTVVNEPEEIVNKDVVADDLAWLENGGHDPWDSLKSKWESTSKVRRSEYLRGQVKIHEYQKKYEALQKPFGSKLMNIDFKIHFSEADKALIDIWPVLCERIIKEVQSRCSNDTSFRKLIKRDFPHIDLLSTRSAKERSFYGLRLFPYLFDAITLSPGDRISKFNIREDFILYVPKSDNTRVKLQERYDRISKNKENVQPIPVFTGTDGHYDAFLEVNHCMYDTETPLNTIDSAFKAFMVLDCQYPKASAVVWTFIQRFIFKIHTPHDVNYIQLEVLAAELGLT